MKSFFFALLFFSCSFTSHALYKVVVSNSGQGWSNPSNFLPSGVPQSGDEVFIPLGLTITVKGNIYNGTTPILKIYALGTLDFDPSGKLDLNALSVVQLHAGGKITSNGSSSEQIRIGGLLKYQGSTDGTVLGPKYASAGTAVSGASDDAGFSYGVLPIKLHSFTLALDQREATLSWTISQDSNEDTYTLQRKSAGEWKDLKSFKPDTVYKGPQASYLYKDRSPAEGLNLYRLALKSQDGALTYSKILSARFADKKPKTFLYPNPAKDVVNVQCGKVINRGNIAVLNAHGQIVYSIDITSSISAHPLEVGKLRSGTYYVIINDNGSIVAQLPFIKKD